MTDPGAVRRDLPCWHQALAHALTGRPWPELGSQSSPDVTFLAGWLSAKGLGQQNQTYVVPDDLLSGIGPAQFWAVLTRLRAELRPTAMATPSPVLADRPLTADERRLMTDVPPHHGS